MQIQNIYSIRDSAAEAFLPPFFMANDVMAIRAFASLVNEKGHLFNANPQDFALYCIGSFDASHGTITADEPPRVVRGGLALVVKETSGVQAGLPLTTEETVTQPRDNGVLTIHRNTGDLSDNA